MRGKAARRIAVSVILCFLVCAVTPSPAEVTQRGDLRVSFFGGITPHALPRQGQAPIAVSLGGRIGTTDGTAPPQLRSIALAINSEGRVDYRGLPVCRYHQIQPASTREALDACAGSVVGRGTFTANVVLPDQSPFPSDGKVIAFNGILHGRHVIFAHVYGTRPLPQSNVLAFELGRTSGTYRTTLTAKLPRVAAEWGYVSGLQLSLQRNFTHAGQRRSFISAACPAPAGFPGAVFPFARASFGFEDGKVLTTTLTRSCAVASTSVPPKP